MFKRLFALSICNIFSVLSFINIYPFFLYTVNLLQICPVHLYLDIDYSTVSMQRSKILRQTSALDKPSDSEAPVLEL